MDFLKDIDRKINPATSPAAPPAEERKPNPPPQPEYKDTVNIAQEPVKGVFLNKKRVGIIVAVVLTLLCSGVIFAMTAQKKPKSSIPASSSESRGDIPANVNAPKSYADMQKQKPEVAKQATQPAQIPNRSPVVNQNRPYVDQNALRQAQIAQRENEGALKSALKFAGQSFNNAMDSIMPGNNQKQQQDNTATANNQQPYDPNGQRDKNDFITQKRDTSFYASHRLQDAVSPYEIKAGTVIPGVLISGINSDLPGQIIAQVRENIYDTVTGNYLLIPQGSKLIGTYHSGVTYGQERALVIWTRLILPNGQSVGLENMQGSDVSGYSGFHQRVDNHNGRIFSAVLVTGLTGALTEWASNKANNGNTTNINIYGTASYNAMQTGASIGERMAQKALDLQPTIKIDPGYRFNVMVTKDFILQPYGG